VISSILLSAEVVVSILASSEHFLALLTDDDVVVLVVEDPEVVDEDTVLEEVLVVVSDGSEQYPSTHTPGLQHSELLAQVSKRAVHPTTAPFGSHHLSQGPTQLLSLSEQYPCTVGEQDLKSIVQQPVPTAVVVVVPLDEVLVVDDPVVVATVVVLEFGLAGRILTSPQLKNCSGV
jgi:hypothetical protein